GVGGRWWVTAIAVGLIGPSVVLNVVSGALYPHYPEAFDNPVFDLAFPLIAEGYAPYGLGWLLPPPRRGAVGSPGAAPRPGSAGCCPCPARGRWRPWRSWCWRRWR